MPETDHHNSSTAVDVDLRLRWAEEWLSQCPPGEFADVLQDIQAILGNDELLVNLHEAVKRQNVENGVSVSIDLQGEEQKIMLTEFNQQPDGRFVDPDSGTTLTVNHYNLEVEEIIKENWEQDKCDNPQRMALKETLRGYVNQTLPLGQVQVYYDQESEEYRIVMLGERLQPANMRNGQWRSVWRYSPTQGTLTGEIKAIVHYYEDGNVQLHAQRTCEMELKASDSEARTEAEEGSAEKTARAIVAKIRGCEDNVQLAINEAYSQLAETTFKKLRRQLPITRAKVDWYRSV